MKRKIMIIILIGALLCVSLTPVNLKRAKAASAKKTVTVTLDKVSPIKHIVVHTNAKKKSGNIDWNTYYEKVGIQIKIKIVSMKGKPKKGKNKHILF
ncbi:MAG: hypothetical protein OSJ66_08980 [Clostridia bacterium]|nr:hypothetical protein [Clostridia bacterium]